jgi:hypothetical protein
LGDGELISDIIHSGNVFHEFLVVCLQSRSCLLRQCLVLVHLPLGFDEGIDSLFVSLHFEKRPSRFLLFFFKFLLLSSELSLISAKFFFEEVDFVFHFEKPNERVLNLHFVELNRKKHTYCVAYERAELI